MVSVALIEDNRVAREGRAALLNQTGRCRVVAAAGSSDFAVVPLSMPQVVLVDVSMYNGDGLRVAGVICLQCPRARVIVMDVLPAHEKIAEFFHAGVAGFIMKDASLDQMVSTIQTVAAGQEVLPPELTSSLFSQMAAASAPSASARITPREQQVVDLIREGHSNKGIAHLLEIAPETVKSHVRSIMDKLSLHTRLQIAAHAHDVSARNSPTS